MKLITPPNPMEIPSVVAIRPVNLIEEKRGRIEYIVVVLLQ